MAEQQSTTTSISDELTDNKDLNNEPISEDQSHGNDQDTHIEKANPPQPIEGDTAQIESIEPKESDDSVEPDSKKIKLNDETEPIVEKTTSSFDEAPPSFTEEASIGGQQKAFDNLDTHPPQQSPIEEAKNAQQDETQFAAAGTDEIQHAVDTGEHSPNDFIQSSAQNGSYQQAMISTDEANDAPTPAMFNEPSAEIAPETNQFTQSTFSSTEVAASQQTALTSGGPSESTNPPTNSFITNERQFLMGEQYKSSITASFEATDENPDNESTAHCEGSVSPSYSLHSSTAQIPEHESHADNNSTMHTIQDNDVSAGDSIDFSELLDLEKSSSSLGLDFSSTIEIHPQNEQLGGSSTHKYIKRPLNAYMIWTRCERKRLLKDSPNMKMNEVSKAVKMGERWKKMSDKDKKPYFDLARKYQQEHKQALQDHPELQYAPSKKKGPKGGHKDDKQSVCDSLKSQTATPSASPAPRGTPAQAQQLSAPSPAPSSIQQQNQSNSIFSPFQSPLNPGMQNLAQVMAAGIRQNTTAAQQYQGAYPPASTSIPGSFFSQQGGLPQFFQSQANNSNNNNSNRNDNTLLRNNFTQSQLSGMRPQQLLEQYHSSLCQPAFPGITETPMALGLSPYFLNQYYQIQQQQQQQQQNGGQEGSGGGGQGGGGHGQHY